MKQKNTDLNLFKVFVAIYEQRNLTRAAEALSVTQPAVSNALNRLRQNFNDQLFIRTHQGMAPTPFADSVIERIQEALQLLNSSIASKEIFDPATSKRNFSISMNDLIEGMLLPKLMQTIQKLAPNVRLECFYVQRNEVERELGKGSIDLALDAAMVTQGTQLESNELHTATFVCMLGKKYTSVGNNLSMEEYLGLKHLVVSSRRKGLSYEDAELKRLGHKRNISLRIPYYRVAPLIVQQTNLALTIPQSLAEQYKLKTFPLPFNLDPLQLNLYWHRTAINDPGINWLKTIIFELSP